MSGATVSTQEDAVGLGLAREDLGADPLRCELALERRRVEGRDVLERSEHQLHDVFGRKGIDREGGQVREVVKPLPLPPDHRHGPDDAGVVVPAGGSAGLFDHDIDAGVAAGYPRIDGDDRDAR